MKKYDSKHLAIVAMIEDQLLHTGTSVTEISSQTNIGRQQIYRWLNGTATNIHDKSLNAVAKAFGKEILKTKEGIQIHHMQQKEDNQMNLSQHDKYVNILEEANQYQKEKIQRQAVEIDELKFALEHKEAESTHWNMIEFDFYVETKLKMKKMKFSRIINEVTNLKTQSQRLGYSVKEMESLWSIGKELKYDKDIPLRKILDEETIKDINEKTRTFPSIFNTLKAIVGHHYIPMPVIYLHKNGSKIPAISYNKVNWLDMKVYSKVEYLLDF